jgi:hypothetical protein
MMKLDPDAERSARRLIDGAVYTQAMYVAAKLAIADQLTYGPLTAGELATRTGAEVASLRRVLRFLVAQGVFSQAVDGRFALNAAAEYLQTAHPRSLKLAAIRAGEGFWSVTSNLMPAVQSGSTAHDSVHGQAYFERIASEGKEAAFAERMSGSTVGLASAIAADPVLTSARTVVDVGGGNGALLIAVLEKLPHLQGIVFDRAATTERARARVAAAGLQDRCAVIEGDFFTSVPPGDVHILSWILHDWDDTKARMILERCRAATSTDQNGTLMIAELLLPEVAIREESRTSTLFDPFMVDMQMLLLTGGRERTEQEYRELLAGCSYDLRSVTRTESVRGASLLTAALRRS